MCQRIQLLLPLLFFLKSVLLLLYIVVWIFVSAVTPYLNLFIASTKGSLVFIQTIAYINMPNITRSQAGSRQTLDPVASLRANPPERASLSHSDIPQQPLTEGGVRYSNRIGGGRPSIPLAAGNTRPLEVHVCRSDCLSCPALIRKKEFQSNSTGRIYTAIDIEPNSVHCKIQNYIYLLTCSSCNVQYVGESVTPLNLRMNVHRRGKSGCEISIDHYKNSCPGASFSIQILEKLPGNGYRNGELDSKMREYRLEREDHWIKTLRTVYPYGLNEKTKFMNKDIPVGKLFPPLPRYKERVINGRTHTQRIRENPLGKLDKFFTHIKSHNFKEQGNECRRLLEGFRKKDLKTLANEADALLQECSEGEKRWYVLLIDIFFTKIYKEEKTRKKKAPKYILPIYFDNKGLEYIHLISILHNEDIVNKLPQPLCDDEVPSVVYNLSGTIRNQIFNYKQTVNDINISDKDTYGTGISSCSCKESAYIDEQHGHIITGDLRMIENSKLRRLLSKGPNYREPKTINWKKCRDKITEGVEVCIGRLISGGKGLSEGDLSSWKNEILEKVESKITSLKAKIRPKKTKPILKEPNVIEYLKELHRKYVLVPIDKASNNVAIICKKYYVEVILKEISVSTEGNCTYENTSKSKEEILNENMEYSARLFMEIGDKDKELPIMYWLPKLHKVPCGKRFIIASKHCSTKSISKAVSQSFKLIYSQVENFHKKAKFLKNYNKFWILQNSDPVIEIMNKINKKQRAKHISTYDFSTLYTKIPHEKLIEKLSYIIDFVYQVGNKSHIVLSTEGHAFWGQKRSGKITFSKASLKRATNYLISNCYFTVGNVIMRQAIGIPMGIDPAPFWANIFLYCYEEPYISSLISSDKVKARHFHASKRFIDDLCAINDGGEFGKCFQDIYPEELDLKVEHCGHHATFLNLDITIQDGLFVYKLFDKRDTFPFSIIRMPHLDSNIPQSIFYSALLGEFLRIARCTLRLDDFLPKAKELLNRMKKQGSQERRTRKSLSKIIQIHHKSFIQLSRNPENLLNFLY